MGSDVFVPQVLWCNLFVAMLTLVASIIAFCSLVRNDESLAATSAGILMSARTAGVHPVTLPGPGGEMSLLVAEPFGPADVSYKVARFFMWGLNPLPDKTPGDGVEGGFLTESAVLRHCLSSASWALHLCSAASCIAPYLTRRFAADQRVETGHTEPRVCALLYGAAAVGHMVARDLQSDGVLVASYKDHPLVEGAMSLHGILNASAGRNEAYTTCSFASNTCQYSEIDSSGAAPHFVVPVVPFDSVYFGDIRMDTVKFDVVHIDVSGDEALASIAYLKALRAAALSPSFIAIMLYPTPLLEAVVRAADALRTGPAALHMFLSGGKGIGTAAVDSVSSGDELIALLRRVGATAPASRTNARSFVREPLCVLFLSREHKTFADLLRRVEPLSKTAVFSGLFHNPTAVRAAKGSTVPGSAGVAPLLLLLIPAVVAALLIYGAARRGRTRSRGDGRGWE